MTKDLRKLIDNTKVLNETIIAFLDKCNIEFKPTSNRSGNVALVTTGRSYKLDTDDEITLKKIKDEWKYWVSIIEPYLRHNRIIYGRMTKMNQIIDCDWRVHDSSLDKLKNQVDELFNDVINILEIELRYSDDDNKRLSANNLVITINTNSTQIVINNPIQLYDNLIKIVSDSELSESDKSEISELLDNAKSEPQNISKFKSVANWINTHASRASPSLNVVSSLMGIITPFL